MSANYIGEISSLSEASRLREGGILVRVWLVFTLAVLDMRAVWPWKAVSGNRASSSPRGAV